MWEEFGENPVLGEWRSCAVYCTVLGYCACVCVCVQLWHAKEGQGPRDKRGRLPTRLPWRRGDWEGSVRITIKMERSTALHACTHTHKHKMYSRGQSKCVHTHTHTHTHTHLVFLSFSSIDVFQIWDVIC